MNLLASLNRWHNRSLIARAQVVNLQAAAEFMAGPPPVAADFELDGPNPLAVGHFCGACGHRLDKPERPCAMGPHSEETR